MIPHGGQRVARAGTALDAARLAMILVHGRGASPANILDLVPRIDRPEVAYLAPAAANNSWYPLSFLSERDRNEPGISSGLAVLHDLVLDLTAHGIPAERTIIAGFSQGACLASEFVYRYPATYGGVIVFSGGLIGPPGTEWTHEPRTLDRVPVFMGCSDTDSHVPAARVRETARVFRQLGADVQCRLYPGMGHVVNDEEIAHAQGIVDRAMGASRRG